MLLFNRTLCLLLGCLFSLAPVFLASRTDLQSVLRSGHGGGTSKGASRVFSFLIGAEAAFALLLLVGSRLIVRSLIRLQQADHGFRPDHVLTMRVPIGSLRQMAFYAEVVDRLSKVPGVRAAAVVKNLPLSEAIAPRLLYDLSATDAATYAGAVALLLSIGAAASVRPAWKASTADPLEALRES